MSTSESTILGLRTQILENWRYMYPGHTNVVVLTTRERKGCYSHMDRFEAIIAEDRSMGTRVFVKASSLGTYEAALRLLLDMTSDMMKAELEDQSAQLLNVKHLDPDITSTQQNNNETVKSTKKPTQNTNKLVQSPEEVEVIRFHNTLGRVIDRASRSESSSFASRFRFKRRGREGGKSE